MLDVGTVISGKYKLVRLLGDGGMGAVYESEHVVLGTHVAIKVLHTDLARKAGLIDRFLQEARVSAQIRSPHVVHVTDVDRTPDGLAYLVMELLQGEPLSNVVKRERKLSVGTASEYTLQILQALEAAHALGVIHRDLKPDNVFVTFEGGKPVLKLIDFGIAKLKVEGPQRTKNLTVAGMLMGTPEYMAPEQAYSAAEVDVRADLYAVGVMMYEMLSGKTPVSGDDPRIVVLKVERGEVTPLVHLAPEVPPELAGFVHRAMAPRPEMRFANAVEMRMALEAIASGKKAGTARIPMKPTGSDAPAAAPAPAPAPRDPGSGPPPPAEVGTGTVMGAPAAAALGSGPPPADPYAQPPGGGTLRAAPLDGQAFRGPPPQAATPYYDTGHPAPRRKSGGSGLIVALALVALLLGAGAVITYVMETDSGPSPSTIDPLATATSPALNGTSPTGTPTGTPTGAVTTAAPLTNAPTSPTSPRPPPPHPSGSVGPKPPPSGQTPPPFPLPSGFPSSFPIPSGFPSLQIPSTFPPIFPQSPAPPPSSQPKTP